MLCKVTNPYWETTKIQNLADEPKNYCKMNFVRTLNPYTKLKTTYLELWQKNVHEKSPEWKVFQNVHFNDFCFKFWIQSFNDTAPVETTQNKPEKLWTIAQDDDQIIVIELLIVWWRCFLLARILYVWYVEKLELCIFFWRRGSLNDIGFQYKCSTLPLFGRIVISTNYWMGVPRVWRFALSVSLEWLWLAMLQNLELTASKHGVLALERMCMVESWF